MAKLSLQVQVNGLKVLRKWMDDKEVVRLPDETEDYHAGYLDCWQHIREGIERLYDEDEETREQPEHKTGRWLADKDGAFFCDRCGKYAFETDEYHITQLAPDYCPNCGAKMEGKDG